MATKHQRRPQKRLPSSFSRVRNYQETATIATMIMITNPGGNSTEIGLRTVKDSVVHTTTIKITTLTVEDLREDLTEVVLREDLTEDLVATEDLAVTEDLTEAKLR
jgi:mannitol-specific phosphotransferase system IIBC component